MGIEPRTLTEMQNRLTAYEVVARHEDGREQRLAFSEKRTKRVLVDIAFANRETLLPMLGDWTGDDATYNKATGWTFGPVSVRFSGRTERDIASSLNLV